MTNALWHMVYGYTLVSMNEVVLNKTSKGNKMKEILENAFHFISL